MAGGNDLSRHLARDLLAQNQDTDMGCRGVGYRPCSYENVEGPAAAVVLQFSLTVIHFLFHRRAFFLVEPVLEQKRYGQSTV